MRLLVADGSRTWRRRLAGKAAEAAIQLVAEAGDIAACLELVAATNPDLALIDAELPGGGTMAVARIRARHPRVQVVIVAANLSEEEFFAALRAGADGVVLKTRPLDRLPAVLHAVMAGELVIPRHLVRPVVEHFVRHGGRRPVVALPGAQKLSSRERQAVALLLQGLTTVEIAEQMFVEPGSVRVYVSRALSKLRIENREALRRADVGRQRAPGA